MLFEYINDRIHTAVPETMSLFAASSNSGCAKCGIIKKSGKRSCCARGGSWFKNCGDAGDIKFDHTWAGGAEACRKFPTSTPLQMMLRDGGSILHPLDNPVLNDTQQQTKIFIRGNMPNTGTMNSITEYLVLTQVGVCIYALFTISPLRT